MTDEMDELRETMARIREEAKGLLGNYGSEREDLSAMGDPYHQMPNLRAEHFDDAGCDEDVSFRRLTVPSYFDTDPQHESFLQPKQDINGLLLAMMELIDSLRKVASPEMVRDSYEELLEKNRVVEENYHAVSQRYWPDSDNNDIAAHLFGELAVEIERMRAEATGFTPAPEPQP